MDRPRTDQTRRRRKRWVVASGIALALAGVTVAVTRLKPAAPTVERSLVWIDTVKRGEMLREVRGIGTLVPEQISWIAARSAGRVDRILLRPGATVKPEDAILILSNPEVAQAAADGASQLKASEADLKSFKVQLESSLLASESTAAAAKADYEQANLRAQVNEDLFKKGLVSELEMRLSKVTAEQADARNTIEQKRFAFARDGVAPQLAMKVAEVDRVRTQAKLRQDTRNGVVEGHVSRIDPAVQNGTVLVDVSLQGELPPGARPDLSIDGTIQLERLEKVVFVGRPAFGQEKSVVGMFKLDADGLHATRTPVHMGRSSVNTIEVVSGLKPGDRVILSDTSQWDDHGRIRLN